MKVFGADPDEEINDDDRPHSPSDEDVDGGFADFSVEEDVSRVFSTAPIDAPLILAPYSTWNLRPVPDPHSASASEIMEVLIEIVAAEGPVVCRRAYSLYNKAAGNSRLGRQIVQVMDRAMYRALKLGHLVQNDEQSRGDQINQVVRVTGSPEVNVRDRGPRTLDELPPLEIRAVREKLLRDEPGLDEEQLVRQMAAVYGIVRKTAQIREMLLG